MNHAGTVKDPAGVAAAIAQFRSGVAAAIAERAGCRPEDVRTVDVLQVTLPTKFESPDGQIVVTVAPIVHGFPEWHSVACALTCAHRPTPRPAVAAAAPAATQDLDPVTAEVDGKPGRVGCCCPACTDARAKATQADGTRG